MRPDDWRAEAKAAAIAATQRFLVVDATALLSSVSDLRGNLSPRLSALAAAFEQSIVAVCVTVGMPVALASAASERSHWQRIDTAERIRALKLDAEPGEDNDSLEARRALRAHEVASQRMQEFATSADGRDTLAADTCQFLLSALESVALGEAANELLRQGIVLTWSALEILSRDLFEALLNAKPERALIVLKQPVAKNRLQSKFTLEELATAGFDLSSTLGSMLSSQLDFSNIRTIKAVMLPVLGSEPGVDAALGEETLWVLCQQRHLIVHRRGFVDARYIEATGESRRVGERLVVGPDDLEAQLTKVVSAGRALLAASSECAV